MKKMFYRIPALVLSLVLALSLAACGKPAASSQTVDRSGAPITLPASVGSIVVLAPSITETVIALGAGDKIIATDTQSLGLAGLAAGLPAFDLATPDAEQLAALNPDIILVSGLSMPNGESPFKPLTDLGICVATIPTSESIAAVKEDIAFIAVVLGKTAEGEKINSDLQAEINRIAAIAGTITDKKTVYFEIAGAPEPYSFGSGVFLNEMIELIGAKNVFADKTGWLKVEPESAIAANPDVILTNVNYIENPVEEILGRAGWGEMTAIKNKDVYYIDNMASALPNQNIVIAMREMAKAVYPELYKELS